MLSFKKVAVGISGGVDSAIAALLLKNRGYDVTGVFMQNWDISDENGQCSTDKDLKDAQYVCKKLNIPLHHVSFVKQYWNEVFGNLIKEYEEGRTPNPDILCNRNIKFKYFFDYAIRNLGVDAIATGHYARTTFGSFLQNYSPNQEVRLLKSLDRRKDQTFFLCQIDQTPLRKTMFPVGEMLKSEVKAMAFEIGLEKIATKRESMGICFIGSRNFQQFISEYIEDRPGDFVDLDSGESVGKHRGIHHWTLGQRSKISGVAQPYFIARKESNNILVASGTDHPILLTKMLITSKPHWISSKPEDLEEGILECQFKFQHTELWDNCQVFLPNNKENLIVKLEAPKRAVTAGQYAVFWKGEECLGSAKILNCISEFTLNYERYSNASTKRNNQNTYRLGKCSN